METLALAGSTHLEPSIQLSQPSTVLPLRPPDIRLHLLGPLGHLTAQVQELVQSWREGLQEWFRVERAGIRFGLLDQLVAERGDKVFSRVIVLERR